MTDPKYRIKKGDTLTAIAAKTGFTVAEIAEANDIENPDLIYAGAIINLPLTSVDSGRWKGIQKKLEDTGIAEESAELTLKQMESEWAAAKEGLRETFQPIIDVGQGVASGIDAIRNTARGLVDDTSTRIVDSVTSPVVAKSDIEEAGQKSGINDGRRGVGLAAFSDPNDPTKLDPQIIEFLSGLNPFRDKSGSPSSALAEAERIRLSKKGQQAGEFIGRQEILPQTSPKQGRPISDARLMGLPALRSMYNKARTSLPINMRQFFDMYGTMDTGDFSESQLNAVRDAYARSQTKERLADKKARGLDPNLVEYTDWATQGADERRGAQYADVGGEYQSPLDFVKSMFDPSYQAKSLLGQFNVETNPETGRPMIRDPYDFPPATTSTGLPKLLEYLQSIPSAGISPYQQLRNYAGYYGPQEGSGRSGLINVELSKGGRVR
mgnify:CR=1 FL=1